MSCLSFLSRHRLSSTSHLRESGHIRLRFDSWTAAAANDWNPTLSNMTLSQHWHWRTIASISCLISHSWHHSCISYSFSPQFFDKPSRFVSFHWMWLNVYACLPIVTENEPTQQKLISLFGKLNWDFQANDHLAKSTLSLGASIERFANHDFSRKIE